MAKAIGPYSLGPELLRIAEILRLVAGDMLHIRLVLVGDDALATAARKIVQGHHGSECDAFVDEIRQCDGAHSCFGGYLCVGTLSVLVCEQSPCARYARSRRGPARGYALELVAILCRELK